jgi:hypothetical protein
MTGRGRIVVLGMLTRHPVAGMVWLTVQHLLGFECLGFEVWYVEPHAGSPHQKSAEAAGWLDRSLRRFGLGDRWALDAVHGDGRCYGVSRTRLRSLYRSAALIVNLHGASRPLPELTRGGRLVYLGTDPMELEIDLHEGGRATTEFLAAHCAHFTWAQTYGTPRCRVPKSARFDFLPTRQPIVMELWEQSRGGRPRSFTTIGNWRQDYRVVEFAGETYHWSKHHEFLRFLELPRRTGARFELALASIEPEERAMLDAKGWRVRGARDLSTDVDVYRDYIAHSRGEWSVAKELYWRTGSGWFSDRSACYLAAGRPVILEDTGFSNVLPTGEGLHAFSTLDEAAAAVEAVDADYRRARRSAREIAREYFRAEKVLGDMVSAVGL